MKNKNNNNSQGQDILVPYSILPKEEIERRFKVMEDLWKEFLASEGEAHLNYYIHKENMFEVINRQDQRMHYFRIFHELEYPCEYKYIAIECFWLNTLKPFIVINEKSKIYTCPNEMFSLYLIISTIRVVFELYKKGKKFNYPSTERIRDILYDFKYCSLSREALIAFVETFADTYGVGIDFILKNKVDISKALKNNLIGELWKKYDKTDK